MHFNPLDISWIEVNPAYEPPDWYLEIGPERYAVEATSIVEYLSDLGPNVSSVSISASLHDLVDEVEAIARSQGILNGGYWVELAPLPDFNKNREWLREALINYVRDTCDMDEAEQKDFGKIKDSNLSIRKFRSDKDYIGEMISFGVKSGHEASIELSQYIATSISKKAHLLRNIGEPIILLILDSYNYSHLADWKEAISGLKIPVGISVVARTEPGSPADIIYSALSPPFVTRD